MQLAENEIILIAIVEDNDIIRDSLKILINGSPGFECNLVYKAAEDIISALPPLNTDIILMDIHLPGITGIECIWKIKNSLPHTQFMMYSVSDDDEDIFNALKAGANSYVLKRTSPSQILDAFIELKNGGSPMSSEIARKVISIFKETKPSEEVNLSKREMEILKLLADGYLYKEIATELDIATETVKKHLYRIYNRLQVSNRTEAVNKVFGSNRF
jgi:DNA-binding NarL/FixJ family response regulator